ncbi:MAG TPA: GIY-YIG nuclease family protein [Candidatus Baltobacteraceae bacterium]|nr:GIY-YIG nuclease family protein [Candidatus Baltobacteraceae bacterium]
MKDYYVYMLLCADGSYYVGVTSALDERLWQHENGYFEECYTYTRRPLKLVHCSQFSEVADAIDWEKRLKGWSRAKKRALANDNWPTIRAIVTAERRKREALR